MANLQIDPNFAHDYTEIANLLPPSSAKDKQLRNAKRLQIMAQTGQDWQDVILDVDREPSGFDSKGLYESIAVLTEVQQKSMQHGVQWLNHMDGITPVLIGSYARSHYANTVLTAPTSVMTFVTLAYKFEKFVQYAKTQFDVIVSPDGTMIEIPSLAAKVYSSKANRLFDDILFDAKLVKIFGGLVLVSPRESLWDII